MFVNWGLVYDGVVPRQPAQAFGNISIESLAKRLGSKGESEVQTSLSHAPVEGLQLLEAGEELDFDGFDAEKERVTEYLSTGIDLYMEDGALGSFRGSTLATRVITDCPQVALLAKNMLVRMPKFDPQETRPLTIYVPTGLEPLAPAIGGAVCFQQEGDGPITGAKVLLPGLKSQATFLDATSMAVGAVLSEADGVLPLSCTSLLVGDKSALVFGAPDDVLAETGAVHGSRDNLWGPAGVSPLWNGCMLPVGPGAGPKKSIGGKHPAISLRSGNYLTYNKPSHNLLPSPTALIFFKAGATKELSAPETVKALAEASGVEGEEGLAAITAKAESSKGYQVGSAKSILEVLS